ncbi:MAG: hypothetical protein K0S34_34 [Bacillales bacterium]|jgi:hypothetical protein|nr:hypothetical protein [Bacillales bacterium]
MKKIVKLKPAEVNNEAGKIWLKSLILEVFFRELELSVETKAKLLHKEMMGGYKKDDGCN